MVAHWGRVALIQFLRLLSVVLGMFILMLYLQVLPLGDGDGDGDAHAQDTPPPDTSPTGVQTSTPFSALAIDISGPIGPAIEDHVVRGFEEALIQGHDLIILRIDTPGGLESSTRGIIKAILASPIPVLGYVTPSGGRAASAGAYILLACHVAAMAPGTNVGSATPVMLGGMPTSPGRDTSDKSNENEYPTLQDKVINDSRAFMRALAALRGRPVEAAEQFVSEAKNFTAAEAREMGLIDRVSGSLPSLLAALHGMEVRMGEGTVTLVTSNMAVHTFEPTWRDEFLALITNPNIAYLLLIAGIYGLMFEFTNPGLIVPGLVGAIALILGLYALQMLPVNYAGLALMALGVMLMVAEAFAPSFGALGLGGATAFVLGSVLLLEEDVPGFVISPYLIGAVTVATAGLFLFVMTFALRAWRRPAVSGVEAMVGLPAEVLRWRGERGNVRTHGEVWAATGPKGLKPGDNVFVSALEGLTLSLSRTLPEADSTHPHSAANKSTHKETSHV